MSDDTTRNHDDAEKKDLNDQLDEKEAEQKGAASESGDDIVQKLMTQNEDLTNKWKRAVADYQNLEKQVRREQAEFMKYASANVLERFLPILDHMDQAVSGMSDEEKKGAWAVGILITVKMFKDMLKDEGMVEIKAEGELFDVHKMEAVDTVDGEKDKVVKVLRRGYECFGKVIRPAQVIIGKGV